MSKQQFGQRCPQTFIQLNHPKVFSGKLLGLQKTKLALMKPLVVMLVARLIFFSNIFLDDYFEAGGGAITLLETSNEGL